MKFDQLLALREAVIEAGFAVLPRTIVTLLDAVAPLPSTITTVSVKRETGAGPLKTQHTTPAEPADTDSRSADEPPRHVLEEAAAAAREIARRSGRTHVNGMPAEEFYIRDTYAGMRRVVITPEARDLANALGYVIVPTHRGVEVLRNDVRVFVGANVGEVHKTLVALHNRKALA